MSFYDLFLIIGVIAFSLPLAAVVYGIAVLAGMLITVNKSFTQDEKGIDIFISTNGLHTTFILPSVNASFNWLSFLNTPAINNCCPAYLSFGWGDKAIYVEVPEWSQLTLSVGFRSLFLPTPPIFKIVALNTLPEERMARIRITPEQYEDLCDFIRDSFERNEEKKLQFLHLDGYAENDFFFDARGQYHAFNTCNTWTNKGLQKTGIRASLWATLDKTIFYQLNKISQKKAQTNHNE